VGQLAGVFMAEPYTLAGLAQQCFAGGAPNPKITTFRGTYYQMKVGLLAELRHPLHNTCLLPHFSLNTKTSSSGIYIQYLPAAAFQVLLSHLYVAHRSAII
jgi:hypothetical protein